MKKITLPYEVIYKKTTIFSSETVTVILNSLAIKNKKKKNHNILNKKFYNKNFQLNIKK